MAAGLGRLCRGALPLDAGSPQRVPVISGAFLLIRRSLWSELGGFDPRFTLYSEEVDLCKRVADRGLELWADPGIEMLHDCGSGDPTCPRRRTRVLKGVATYLRKHHGPLAATFGCLTMLLEESIRYGLAPLIALRNPRRAEGLRRRCGPQIRNCARGGTDGSRAKPSADHLDA